jgi:hypothetical protein
MQKEMNRILYICVYENLTDQAQLHARTLNIKGDGHTLIVELFFMYAGYSTKQAVDLTQEIGNFASWLPSTANPTDAILKYQALNTKLAGFENYGLNDTLQCSFLLQAFQQNPHYRQFVIQYQTAEPGTIKLKDLCSKAVKYWETTHDGWAWNVSAEEHRGKKHDDAKEVKELRKQVNNMLAQRKQTGRPSAKLYKRAVTPSGGRGGFVGNSRNGTTTPMTLHCLQR